MALIRGPIKSDDVTIIANLYKNERRLEHDYERVAEYPKETGGQTIVPTAHLCKSSAGLAFVDFGWRWHLPKIAESTSSGGYHESPSQRVSIPVVHGGSNRITVMNHLANSSELWVVFCLLDSFDGGEVGGLWRSLRRGVRATGSGKLPIELQGISVFGRFVRVGKEDAY